MYMVGHGNLVSCFIICLIRVRFQQFRKCVLVNTCTYYTTSRYAWTCTCALYNLDIFYALCLWTCVQRQVYEIYNLLRTHIIPCIIYTGVWKLCACVHCTSHHANCNKMYAYHSISWFLVFTMLLCLFCFLSASTDEMFCTETSIQVNHTCTCRTDTYRYSVHVADTVRQLTYMYTQWSLMEFNGKTLQISLEF